MVIEDMDKCTKSPTGEHVWNYTPRPDNCRLGTCRYCEQQRVFEGAMATHTAAILAPAPVKPETMAKAVEIAEKSLERVCPQRGKRLSDGDKKRLRSLLAAGVAPAKIADEMGISLYTVYLYRRTTKQVKEIARINTKAVSPAPAPVPPAAPEVKRNGHNRIAVVYDNQHRGNLALQLLRLKRGELKPQTTKTVILRYKAMLEYDLGKAQEQVRVTKSSLASVNDALRELEIIENGQKTVVDKVLAAVR